MESKTRRLGACALVVIAAATVCPEARAGEDEDCPKDAFCEDVGGEPPPGAGEPGSDAESDPGRAETPSAEAPRAETPGDGAGSDGAGAQPSVPQATQQPTQQPASDGRITVYVPPSSKARVVVVAAPADGGTPQVTTYEAVPEAPEREHPDAPDARPPQKRDPHVRGDRAERTLGLSLRGSSVLLPERAAGGDDAKMGGAGVSLRYRPAPPVAFDFGLDVLMGKDENGRQRREVPFGASMLLYLLPTSVVQPYAIVGLDLAYARVESSTAEWNLSQGTSDRYTYIGGHAGLGVDLRLAQALSVGVDGLAYVRGRVDERARDFPEFYDAATGEASNTSTGGQLRGAITFWW